ncbi:hypothetical protein AALP_AA1G234600 [Arabis alpina]|uniref:Replication factor A C-terminal domain-containing protein n=1 Tax=Arabis alpina TaxID=50452 RepID=A0A087HQ52_ARAAL|nr:hypothetical protein AALP_AA1G234600 [Arabis alpina]
MCCRGLLLFFAIFFVLLQSSTSSAIVNPSRVKQAFVYEGFLTELECDHVVSLAKADLKRSAVADNDSGQSKFSEVRTSSDTFISKGKISFFLFSFVVVLSTRHRDFSLSPRHASPISERSWTKQTCTVQDVKPAEKKLVSSGYSWPNLIALQNLQVKGNEESFICKCHICYLCKKRPKLYCLCCPHAPHLPVSELLFAYSTPGKPVTLDETMLCLASTVCWLMRRITQYKHLSIHTKESTYQMLLHKYHVSGIQIKLMKRKILLGRPSIFFLHALFPVVRPGIYLYGKNSLSNTYYQENLLPTSASGNGDSIPTDFQSIGQVLAFVNDQGGNEKMFWCKAKVVDVILSNGWFFIACKGCSTKMTRIGGKITCQTCPSAKAVGVLRYRIEVIVEDDSDTSTFVIFEKAGEKC